VWKLETEPLHCLHHSLAGCHPPLSTFCPLSRVGADDHDAFVLPHNYLCELFENSPSKSPVGNTS
jgi:hypothetical protein